MARDIDVDIFEIMLSRALHDDVFIGRDKFGRGRIRLGANRFGDGSFARFLGFFEGFVGVGHEEMISVGRKKTPLNGCLGARDVPNF